MTVKELENQIQDLTFAEKAQILQFLLQDFTAFWIGSSHPSREISQSLEQQQPEAHTAKFDVLAGQLMNLFSKMAGQPAPILSDYAISRTGIYEEHA